LPTDHSSPGIQLGTALCTHSAHHLAAVIAAYVNRSANRSVVVAIHMSGLVNTLHGYQQAMMERLAALVSEH